MSDSELEKFKTEINLSEFAASYGYQMVRSESSRNSVAMRNPTGDKIIIARGQDNHWVYFSIRDPQDNGTIIDFIQHRAGGSLGEIRISLRQWIGQVNIQRPLAHTYAPKLEKSSLNRQAIIQTLSLMEISYDHPYLRNRAVGKGILSSPRFAGRVRIDRFGAAIFPHEDENGLCGYEMKNLRFTGFSAGGEKGLWRSNVQSDDEHLVVCESAIDALSYHALYPNSRTRYVSAAGGWSNKTRELLRRAGEKHPGSKIVLAFDNDSQGHEYTIKAQELLADIDRVIRVDYPTIGKDWNDQLRAVQASSPNS